MSDVRITGVTIPGAVLYHHEARIEELAQQLPIERQDTGVPERLASQWFRPVYMTPRVGSDGYFIWEMRRLEFPDPPLFRTVSSQRTILGCNRVPRGVFEPR